MIRPRSWATCLTILMLLVAVSGEVLANCNDRTSKGQTPVNTGRSRKNAGRLETVGLYVSLPTDPPPSDPRVYDFYKACGYNYLEFCEAGFRTRPDLLPAYYRQMSRAINLAHRKGFRVGVVLLAGMHQWKGPGKSGYLGAIRSLDKTKLDERISYLRQAVQHLPNADSFVFFPGDPGGDPEGHSTLKDCLAFTRQVHQIVRQKAPRATFMMNLWALPEWEGFPSPFSLHFWQQEVTLSRAIATAPDFLGPDCGVAFTLDNYYRPLALTCYAQAGVLPELYPTTQDIQRLRSRGVKPMLGWPYFLVDEVDEGFISPNNVASGGQSQGETRYIRALIERGRALGLDGLVANAIFFKDEALNIYAFGQMCRSADLTPEQLIDRYARLIAEDNTGIALGKVLRFIENHSSWQNSLPASSRLQNFEVPDVPSAATALTLLAQVRPRVHSTFPFLEPPTFYLRRLKKRLETIAAGKIGGGVPIIKSTP
jgi:hypothetical protein